MATQRLRLKRQKTARSRPYKNFRKTQRVPQGRRSYGCSAEEHGAPGLLMQPRQLLVRGASPEVWSPWPKEISSNFMNWPT